MVEYIWRGGEEVPMHLDIRQVHGILMTPEGRILLRIKNGSYRLTGGHPEPEDANEEATLIRESLEEADCEISHIHYLGYQEVQGDGEPYAQVRMVALIDKINPATPDPDRTRNWIYGRILVSPGEAIRILPFGDINEKLVNAAVAVAREQKLCDFSNLETELINEESRDKE